MNKSVRATNPYLRNELCTPTCDSRQKKSILSITGIVSLVSKINPIKCYRERINRTSSHSDNGNLSLRDPSVNSQTQLVAHLNHLPNQHPRTGLNTSEHWNDTVMQRDDESILSAPSILSLSSEESETILVADDNQEPEENPLPSEKIICATIINRLTQNNRRISEFATKTEQCLISLEDYDGIISNCKVPVYLKSGNTHCLYCLEDLVHSVNVNKKLPIDNRDFTQYDRDYENFDRLINLTTWLSDNLLLPPNNAFENI